MGVGTGHGYGYGHGHGYGYGDAHGYGDGNGNGYGCGNGHGYGYSDGDGYGYGSKKYWGEACKRYLSLFPEYEYSEGVLALWFSREDGKPIYGIGGPVYPGQIQKEGGPLQLCSTGTLHATHSPGIWLAARAWLVCLHGEVIREGDKLGALERTIIGEVPL